MTLSDSFALAFRTVRSNRLRTGITVAIIAFGIMALIGIITAIDAMNGSLRESFSTMGANGFTIAFKERIRFGNNNQSVKLKKGGRRQKKSNLDKPISLADAESFKQNFHYPGLVSISLAGRGSNEVHYKDIKTNPNVRLTGGDENYLAVNGFTVGSGRNFTPLDVYTGHNVCLLGIDVANKLFNNKPEKAVDKVIKVGAYPYRVIGVLKSKGTSAMMRSDNVVITTYNNVRRVGSNASSYVVGVLMNDVRLVDGGVNEATGTFRAIRKLHPTEDDNFVIEKSDKLAEKFISLLSSIQGAAAAIGLITLIGAAIGLMNIMLVAVSERTREVGLIKAIGGKRKNIRQQFLFESTIISLLGAFFGIVLGVLVGNGFALFLGTGFVVPWAWVIIGIVICTLVGLGAGIWPAVKASRLNPINALRYE
ncbi:putative ABC transport system permease protein [Filimonas lacunae]|uniref:Putative ABC transport system permease protein n=1 Tax=Filimonas lacunae TaxID=477680 RepID=A0A173MMS6_9BACT|nr:ABC transporter permease [Filimonas lacunae]BAV08955.1 cell division protein FtsX [Filimonas lacunae]SIS64695.1 putative ABC transport system permease protein [Filimonas lacunae]